jgi:hypothetical protein
MEIIANKRNFPNNQPAARTLELLYNSDYFLKEWVVLTQAMEMEKTPKIHNQ